MPPGNKRAKQIATYVQAFQKYGSVEAINVDEVNPPTASFAAAFVLDCVKRKITPRSNMARLTSEFHQALVQRNWEWQPSKSGDTQLAGAQLLDGVALAGECAFPTWALIFLVNAPFPYGFGIGGAKKFTYSGDTKHGFLAAHKKVFNVPDLSPIDADGKTSIKYRYWNNHKVVEYFGHFYDPNYGLNYKEGRLMAVATLEEIHANVNPRNLEEYNGLPGLPKLIKLTVSDCYYGTHHTISVYKSTSIADPTVAGFFIERMEDWMASDGPHIKKGIYGPFNHDPVVP